MDPSANDPISCTNLPSSNSNGNLFIDLGLLIGTYNFNCLNISNKGRGSNPSVCSPIACRPFCVYCCYCCKYLKCCGLPMVFVQSSYIFPSKSRCSSPSRNLVSCSLLTSYLCSLSYFSSGDVIYGTSCLSSLNCPSYGNVIYGTFIVYLATCTTIGIANGSTLPFIIFCALASMLSSSLFTLEPEAPLQFFSWS